jgi:hypothetical protein
MTSASVNDTLSDSDSESEAEKGGGLAALARVLAFLPFLSFPLALVSLFLGLSFFFYDFLAPLNLGLSSRMMSILGSGVT